MGVLEASSVQISFVDNEIIEAKDKVLEYLKDPKLEKYTYKINSLLSYEAHILPKEQEELLAKVESIADTSSQVFNALRLEYEDVEEDKKKQNYNPLAIYSKKADFEEFAGHLPTMMIAEASRAFEQLPILKNAEILRNILYSGVWCRYEMIKEKRRQKAGEKADE